MRHGWLPFISVCLLLVGCGTNRYVTTLPKQAASMTVEATATMSTTTALTQYRNANPYLPEPQFEVSYDPTIWSLD